MGKLLLFILVIMAAFWVQSLGAEPEGETKDDPKVAEIKALIHQADSLAKAGRVDTATVLGNIALEEARKGFGEPDSIVAKALDVLGLCCIFKGDYSQCELLWKATLDMRKTIFHPHHPKVAESLNNLGAVYLKRGHYAEAELLLKEALEIYERALATDHPEVARSLVNLARVYEEQGHYAEAEFVFREALEILKGAFGSDHPDVATGLNNLATLYGQRGHYAEAELLFKEALEIDERAFGPDHPRVLGRLHNLAAIYGYTGRYIEAELLFKRALKIWEKISGPDHPNLAVALNNLGKIYTDMGRYAEAERLHKRSLEIKEKTLGSDHPDLLQSLNNLGVVYNAQGRYAEAEPLFRRALEILEGAVGPSHPHVAITLNNLADLFGSTGRYDESIARYHRAQESRRSFINSVFSYASEVQKLKYTEKFSLINSPFLSLVLIDDTFKSREPALEMLFDGKGAVLEAISIEKEVAYCSYDSTIIEKYEELNSVGGGIAAMVLERLGRLEPEEYRDSLQVLTQRKEKLEAELSQACSEFAEALALQGIRVKDVAQALPPGSVLWEIVRYLPYDFDKVGSKKEKTGLPRYMAFQLSKDGNIQVVDLGEAALIDPLVAAYQGNLSEAREAIYEGDERGAERRLSGITRPLYDMVFAPLEKHLKGNRRIFVSPDGELNLLPYCILPCPDGKYVIEKYEISYLSSGRDLVKFLHRGETESDYALVMTNPDYNMELIAQAEQLAHLKPVIGSSRPYTTIRGPSDRAECLNDPFNPLSATQREGRIIAALIKERGQLQTYHYYGAKASEETLKRIDTAPRVLHLATHGYFCPKASFSAGVRIFENPLLYSGLALSGANQVIIEELEGYRQAAVTEDGILTSLEVSGLNLVGTDLVVLSACQTGVGQVKNGEGVFGLRRSLQHAGARSMIMSMWDIPDRETVKLMDDFYREWLSGESKSRALRKSALKILSERRKSRGAAHPYFWGGFVLVGDPE